MFIALHKIHFRREMNLPHAILHSLNQRQLVLLINDFSKTVSHMSARIWSKIRASLNCRSRPRCIGSIWKCKCTHKMYFDIKLSGAKSGYLLAHRCFVYHTLYTRMSSASSYRTCKRKFVYAHTPSPSYSRAASIQVHNTWLDCSTANHSPANSHAHDQILVYFQN